MWQREARWFRRVVLAKDAEMRLDRWLRQQFPSLPQSLVHQQLRKRKIRLERLPSVADADAPPERARASSILLPGSVVAIDERLFRGKLMPGDCGPDEAADVVEATEAAAPPPRPQVLRDLIQRVVYQDEHYAILNKPHGLAVQVRERGLSYDQLRGMNNVLMVFTTRA